MNEILKLDLHRIKHEEAEILVDRFINKNWGKNIETQIESQINKKGIGNLNDLLRGNQVWNN